MAPGAGSLDQDQPGQSGEIESRAQTKARGTGHPQVQSHEPLLPEAKESIEHIADFMRSALPKR